MQIIWHGQSCFQIITARNKNEQVFIVVDPFSEEIGLRTPKLEADILLITHNHSGRNNIKTVQSRNGQSGPFIASGPGEYEIKEVYIRGISVCHDEKNGKEKGENTIYAIEAEDLRICHLGDFDQKELTDDQLEKIGEVDILMVPTGGVSTISAKEALKVMSQIEPKITIPMHYQVPKLKEKLEGLDKFLKLLGIKKMEPMNKLTIKKKDLSGDEAKIIVLKP